MSRNPILKRKKPYKKYEADVIEAALKEYEESKKSYKIIADKHNIPKSVLHRHYTRFMKKQGGQTALNLETEKYIVTYLNICSEWGYPLDTYDLRLLVKGYLDREGVIIKKFKDNMPGPDFIRSFLSRHKQDISLRMSQNIKRVRAAVSPEKINQYFDELELSVEGVPLCNLVNYDETNLCDDPGKRKIICKRGAKYPERVMNSSKASTSLMMAASADGTLLPPYVVYKSQHLYDTWTTGGPKGCKYNRTPSGWFDGHTFEEWVRSAIYSYFKDKPGKKVLIGDNLSSHLSIELIRECKERDIHFVFLPANSTHITQPLDVAFFRPMKIAWRDILFHWKKTDGRLQATVPKACFPQLLKKLLQRLDDNAKQNILSGFSKAGISPLDRKKVLDRLPNNYERDDSIFSKVCVDETVLNMLKEMRYGTGTGKVCNKRKKLNVLPGKTVGSESDYVSTDSSDSQSEIPSTSCKEDTLSDKITKKKKITASTKDKDKEVTNSKGLCTIKKTKKSSKDDYVKETQNIEDDCNATEYKNRVKGKVIGKKIVKYRKEQKENDIKKVLNSKSDDLTAIKDIKSIKEKGIGKKSVKDHKEQKENDIKSVLNSKSDDLTAIKEIKIIKEKGIGNESVKELEERKENDMNVKNYMKDDCTAAEDGKTVERKKTREESTTKCEEQEEHNANNYNYTKAVVFNDNEKQSQCCFNENTLQLSEDLDIEHMPVFFDDGIQLSEVLIVDELETENKNLGSKVKIISDEKVSHLHFSKEHLKLKKVSLTDPMKSSCSLNNKRKSYHYKNDEDILRDLMDDSD